MSSQHILVSRPRAARLFESSHLRQNLRQRSIRAGAVTFSSQIAKFVMRIGCTMILARLLAPECFGLLGMVTAVYGFVGLFQTIGLSQAIVQSKEIDHQQISNLFWITTGLGILLAGITCAASPVVAWFYDEPRLIGMIIALSVGLILGGPTMPHQALLRRMMEFDRIAVIDICSLVIGALCAVSAALAGFGYWALIVQMLATSLFTLTASWFATGWWPGLPLKDTRIRSMLEFGGNLTGFNFITFLYRNLDSILIGWAWGPTALGLYNRAYQLLLLPIMEINRPIGAALFPSLSRLQSEPEEFRTFYCTALRIMTSLGMPTVVFMSVESERLVALLLGPGWEDAGSIFRLLAPAAFLGTFNTATGWIYNALGHTRRQLNWGAISSVIFIVFFFLGLPYGARGLAATYSIASCILIPAGIVYCYRIAPFGLRHLIRALSFPAVASLVCGALIFALRDSICRSGDEPINLLCSAVAYAGLYLLIHISVPEGRNMLNHVKTLYSTIRNNGNEQR